MISELDRLIEQATHYSRRAMRTLGHVPPTILAVTPTGLAAHVPEGLNNDGDKDRLVKIARLIAIGYEASAITLILESWAVFAAQPGKLNMSTPPSQSPNRVEIVAVMAEARQSSRQKLLLIQRDEKGKFIGLSAKLSEITSVSGRFVGLMQPKAPTEADAFTARMILEEMKVVVSVKGTDPRWN